MIIPAASGTVTIGVAANVATDVANNQNTAATSKTVTTNITITPLSERTQQVQDAIVDAVEGADSINDVTEADLAMITQLSLRGKSVTSLKSGDFSGLKDLNYLSLGVNDFTSLPSGIFDQLTDLRSLSIWDGSLTSLPSGIFDKNTELTYINLVRNDLTSLPSGIFDKNTKLTILFLGNNDLTSLPSGIFDKLTALTTLDLRSNDLTSLQSEVFDKNTKLTQLYLHGNDLTGLPSGVFDELTELTLLYIYQNGLARLPSGVFDKNTKLADLKLKFNKIKDVSALENLTSLTTLSIRANPISDYGPIRRLIAAIDAIPEHPGLTLDTPIPSAAPSAQPLSIQTELLANFPNPFNPETWIPYQLAKPADVSLTIYDMRGVVVRELKLGHQPVGLYRSRGRAIHWDGRNVFGERVASGVYLYTFTAGDFTATRKMLILK